MDDTADRTVRLAAEGDVRAFSRLVAQHHGPMIRVAYVVTGDGELAQDAVQSAWTIAWRRLGSLRDAERVGPWLVSIAANEARGILRTRHRHPVVEIPADVVDHGVDPDTAIDQLDLARSLSGLSGEDRALLALRFVAGLDSGEIASHLGLSASGVRSRLARLLERLRAELDHD